MNDDLAVKNYKEKTLCDSCLYNPHYLIVQKKIVSQLIAFFLLLSFFIFALGYFLGKKKLAEDFSHIVDQTNFSDQINFALTSLYERENTLTSNNAQEKSSDVPVVSQGQPVGVDLTPPSAVASTKPTDKNGQESKGVGKYAAQLFGGPEQPVKLFAQRLAKKGIHVEVRLRGKAANGKAWYQAVTKPYTNRNELEALVATIKKLEKISNVSIVPITT
jgi:hypothetical protein